MQRRKNRSEGLYVPEFENVAGRLPKKVTRSRDSVNVERAQAALQKDVRRNNEIASKREALRASRDTRTKAERILGMNQTYVHAGFDPRPKYSARGYGKNPVPRGFLPAGRAPVKGGRWSIRKVADQDCWGCQWHAYSRGSAKSLSQRFATHAEAVQYVANVLASMYSAERVKSGVEQAKALKERQALAKTHSNEEQESA